MDSKNKNINEDEDLNIFWFYGAANFNGNKIIILKEPSENSDIIEDNTVSNPIYFDQIIIVSDKRYISYITLSGIRRYSLIDGEEGNKESIQSLDKNDYMWKIFRIYKYNYIDHYIKPESNDNNKKSLSIFFKTLEKNVQPKALCLCAQFIHWGLNVAGFHFQGKYSAKLYHLEGLLKELGFYTIPNNSELKKGDIVVVVDTKLEKNPDYYGHICAWDGNCWICDEKSKKLNGEIENFHYYRYDLWDE